MEFTEENIRIVELGKDLIGYAYGVEMSDMSDWNDLTEEKERLVKEFRKLFVDDEEWLALILSDFKKTIEEKNFSEEDINAYAKEVLK